MPQGDLALQADLAVRMLIAAVLGAAIGFEREVHNHPAGMRTHLLVSLGSAVFTELSIFGFTGQGTGAGSAPVDPTRIAAQIVTGVGFLGAGAILKSGTSIRGLTTAASLWTTAAIGMAAGAGGWLIAGVGTLIVFISLWPLGRIDERIHRGGTKTLHLRLEVARLDAIGSVSRLLAERQVEIAGINSQRIAKGRYEVDLDLRFTTATRPQDLVSAITGLPDVELMETVSADE
jgi:putative Mg2+ transporter-C (MgtC) family protein